MTFGIHVNTRLPECYIERLRSVNVVTSEPGHRQPPARPDVRLHGRAWATPALRIPQEHMPPGDVLLHAGDFTDSGELEQVESFNQWLERYPAEVGVA